MVGEGWAPTPAWKSLLKGFILETRSPCRRCENPDGWKSLLKGFILETRTKGKAHAEQGTWKSLLKGFILETQRMVARLLEMTEMEEPAQGLHS